MAGHSTLHPYLKSYDEIKRTINRMKNYANMFKHSLTEQEQQSITEMVDTLETVIQYIPEEYQVSRYHQFNKED